MFRAFCDHCKSECDPKNSSTRHFERVKGSIGLEIIPLYAGVVAKDCHICDDCVALILIEGASRYTKSKAVVELFDAKNKAFQFERMNSSLEEARTSLDSEKKEITSLIEEAKACIDEAKALPSVEKEKIKLLEATIASLEARAEARIKRDAGAEAQLTSDEREYPEYVEKVNRRERIRAT